MHPIRFDNPKITGWIVRSRIAAEGYLIDTDDPKKYRRQFVAEGRIGRLTGTIFVLSYHGKTDEYKDLTDNTELMRQLLSQDDGLAIMRLPIFERSLKKRELYLSMPMILGVEWLNSHNNRSTEHGHILPWLQLIG